MINVENEIAQMGLKDSVNDEETTPMKDKYLPYEVKFVKLVNISSGTYTKHYEIGSFTTQEAAQECKNQYLSNEEGWEVKRVSYKPEKEEIQEIWLIRHAV
jgi:hypothetical protein